MILKRKFRVSLVIGMAVLFGLAATHAPADQIKTNSNRPEPETHTSEKTEWKNLKIIPKNTDEDQMERIMHNYSQALGVTCSYCHPDSKRGVFPQRVDFTSDEKPEKLIARKMMRMVDRLNRKNFDYINRYDFDGLKKQPLTCNTCHRGLQKPNNISLVIP